MSTREFLEKAATLDPRHCGMPLVDAHLHSVDLLQEGDDLDTLIDRMDEAGVEATVLFGLPVIKKWESEEPDRPHYYLDDNARCYFFPITDAKITRQIQKLEPEKQDRLVPLLCGFNPTDRNAVFQVEERTSDWDGWKGIGEILCRHDDLTNLIFDETARMNHPALLPVYDLAGTRDLPVLLHQNSSSVRYHDRFEYLHEVREPLGAFPETRFIWAHCGISRRVWHKRYDRMLEDQLEAYPNLSVDLSWVVYEQTVCNEGRPKKPWLDLIERFPDRFMLGSDLCGHFDALGSTMGRYAQLLEALSRPAVEMVASGNAKRIWGI